MSVLVDVVVMKDMDLLVNRLNEFNMPGDLFNQTILTLRASRPL